jgi:flagellar P-ring protein precursor FlgI
MQILICPKILQPLFMIAAVFLVLFLFMPSAEASVRIKDITRTHDQNEIDLLGYGLVIGLDGTGDSKGTQFTMQSLSNMMERLGVTVDAENLKVKNVAAVMVTSRLSSRAREGDRIDITVSSIGDATSLQGGNLLFTPLSSGQGDVYVNAQGPISIGGFNVQVEGGSKIINNYTMVGRIPGGGKVVRRPDNLDIQNELFLILHDPDYLTADRIATRINSKYGLISYVDDAATVRLMIPDSLAFPNERNRLLADIGGMKISPDQVARVVINERTGTIVAGEHVTIAPVAIAHGNITVNVKSIPVISQPEPFSQGETISTAEYQIAVDKEPARVVHLKETVALADVANALNLIGAAPRDIISIFEALKQAGALRAELVII